MKIQALEPEARTLLTQALGQMMSDVSEEQYSAGWMMGLEEELPSCIRHRRETCTYLVDRELANLMQTIADALGHWAALSDDGDYYVPHVPTCDMEEDA